MTGRPRFTLNSLRFVELWLSGMSVPEECRVIAETEEAASGGDEGELDAKALVGLVPAKRTGVSPELFANYGNVRFGLVQDW